jgi:hypothetical protein
MVQAVLDMLSEAFQRIASNAVPVAIAIASVVVLGALVIVVVGVFDRDRVRWAFGAIPLALRPAGAWLVFAIALAGGVFVLHVVQLATDQRFVAMEYAQNTSGADADATPMVQAAARIVNLAEDLPPYSDHPAVPCQPGHGRGSRRVREPIPVVAVIEVCRPHAFNHSFSCSERWGWNDSKRADGQVAGCRGASR